MKPFLPLTLLLAACLSGCASSNPVAEPTARAENDAEVVCTRESGVGTNLPTKRCRSAAQREAESKSVRAFDDAVRGGAGSAGRVER